MAKPYYTFCAYDAEQDVLHDEYGDYSRATVQAEMRGHSAPSRHKRIVTTDGSLKSLLLAKAALPLPKN